ncbi:MAG TPA: acetolactate synthase small subunit [Clostridia bacterium]|jgi:acetolactate synthase-1/3 small subunit|nr:acetolactate synthase small subunit [Clostridia bacterium]
MKDEKKFILSMLVRNEAGVLTRVSGLFARRGFNIDSLSVGETLDKDVSRITITATGDEYIREQIRLQLEKLHDVIIIEEMPDENTVVRELLLIKVNVEQGKRIEILEAATIFRAKVVDLTPTHLTLEITGDSSKCNAFLEYMKPFGVVELCRTGVTAIARGAQVLKA